eukprot:c15885_g1_i3.p1 GENE.c15885_g1_i3~~c15885_g1_i3.p1  ORF type:complete len:319 (+),score=61.64 c15885_g1_i3:364-1320(+)
MLDKHVCCASSSNGKFLFFGRRWDGSIAVISTLSGRIVQSVTGHTGVVDCMCIARPRGTALISGGRDCRVVVWGVVMESSRSFEGVTTGVQDEQGLIDPELRAPLSMQPLRYLNGHTSWVVAVAASSHLDCVMSASIDGHVLQHTLAKGKLIRRLILPVPKHVTPHVTTSGSFGSEAEIESRRLSEEAEARANALSFISVSRMGDIVTCQNNVLYHFSLNGELQAMTSHSEHVTAMTLVDRSPFVLLAGASGVSVYDLSKRLKLVHNYRLKASSTIRCMTSYRLRQLVRDLVFCGLDSGHMIVLHASNSEGGVTTVPN